MKSKTTMIVACSAALALSACGGGGDAAKQLFGVGLKDLEVKIKPSGSMTLDQGENTAIRFEAKSDTDAITVMKWSVSPVLVSGYEHVAPKVSDPDCVNGSRTREYYGTAKANCPATLLIPYEASPGTWKVSGTATTHKGSTKAASFDVVVNEIERPVSGFTLLAPLDPVTLPVNEIATLSAEAKFNPDIVVDDLKYVWTQTSGTTVALSGADRSAVKFKPVAAGEYVFEVVATAKIGPFTEVKQAVIVVFVEDAETGDIVVSAGDAKAGYVNSAIVLTGTVTVQGSISPIMSYQWEQIAGPAVTLMNANAQHASFIPEVAGLYVFQFNVTAQTTGTHGETYRRSAQTAVSVTDPAAPAVIEAADPFAD